MEVFFGFRKLLVIFFFYRVEFLYFIGNWFLDIIIFGIKVYIERKYGLFFIFYLGMWLSCIIIYVWMVEF